MKKKSLTQKIVHAATINPDGVTAAQIKQAVPNTANAVSVVLWKLKKEGVLTHDRKTGTYKLSGAYKSADEATPTVTVTVDDEAPPATSSTSSTPTTPAPKKRGRPARIARVLTTTSNKSIKEYQDLLKRADETYADLAARMQWLQGEHRRLGEQHTDALAVIRYLEDKMFKVIQLDARRGNA